MKRKQVWKKNLDRLTPKQLAKYDDSLDVLRMMRHGTSFSKATKTVRISPPTVKKFLGKVLSKKNKRIRVRKNDSLLRKLRIYENGKEIFIQVRGTKKTGLVGKYHGAVGRFIDKNEISTLESFADKTIRDAFGKIHSFEIQTDKIIAILERHEEPEFFSIYKSGGK